MRVASVISRLHVGGDETRLLALAKHFDPTRVRHLVIVVEPTDQARDERLGPMTRWYREAGVNIEVIGLELGRRRSLAISRRMRAGHVVTDSVNSLRAIPRIAAVLSDHGIHVVDARMELGTVLGTAAARLARTPIVVSTGYSPSKWVPPVLSMLGRAVFRHVDAFVTDAVDTLEQYERWGLPPTTRRQVIVNGIPPAAPTRHPTEVRSELGLPDAAVVIGQLGRIIPRKGCEVMIRAAGRILEAEPDVHFLLCGFWQDDEYRAGLERLASAVGVAHRLHIANYPGQMGDVLGTIDIFVHVSTVDSSPIAVLESMSVGLPAVVSRVGGTAELVHDSVTGLLVPAGDAGKTAEAVLRLLRDPGLAQGVGRGALDRYRARHTPEGMARAHEALFEALLVARNGAAPGGPRE